MSKFIEVTTDLKVPSKMMINVNHIVGVERVSLINGNVGTFIYISNNVYNIGGVRTSEISVKESYSGIKKVLDVIYLNGEEKENNE